MEPVKIIVGPEAQEKLTAPVDSEIPIIRNAPLPQQILAYVRREIVRGRWRPGERLPEPMLCQKLGISRTPLRDALRILETEGLVELQPNRGAVITRPSEADIREKLQVLRALESLAAELTAAGASYRDKTAILALHQRMATAASVNEPIEYYRLNDEFHRAIVLASGNQTLIRQHEVIMSHVHRIRHIANEHEVLSPNSQREHADLVAAIADGDAEAASARMRQHLDSVLKKILTSKSVQQFVREPQG